MFKPVQKLKENIDERKKAKMSKKINNEKGSQMYKNSPYQLETKKKGGAVKKVTAKKVMVKSKKK
jgi:hypothetical protein